MNKLVLVTGGARSGKSSFAENFVTNISKNPLYVATAVAFDDEMQDRIKKHKLKRQDTFKTLERFKAFSEVSSNEFEDIDAILLDCITVMITNIMMEFTGDNAYNGEIDKEGFEQKAVNEVNNMLDVFKKNAKHIVIVTNEIGMGIVPENHMTRLFRDVAGRINQLIAKEADEVYFCVCGISNKIK